MSAPTDTEHPPGKRRPLDAPYPFDGISPSPDSSDDFSSSGAILDFFLRSTTHHTPESLKQHAGELQKTAYDIFPYPCIRSYAFLRAKAAKHPVYPEVLAIGRQDREAIYLDLGCFFGTDARKVIFDGWNPERVIASDLRPEWFDLGYSLFSDRTTCAITFLAGDVFLPSFLPTPFDPSSASNLPPSPPPTSSSLKSLTSLGPLTGTLRAISAFSFFHLFEEPGQHELALKLSYLLSSERGSAIFGSHQGGREMGMMPRNLADGSMRFVHSPESWKDLWEEVFSLNREEGSEAARVRVEARLDTESEGEGLLVWSVVVV